MTSSAAVQLLCQTVELSSAAEPRTTRLRATTAPPFSILLRMGSRNLKTW
jgi:hypothetical protein